MQFWTMLDRWSQLSTNALVWWCCSFSSQHMIYDDLRAQCHFSQVHGFVSWVLFLQPRLNDMDMNQHVNNVKYIGWVLEVPPQNSS